MNIIIYAKFPVKGTNQYFEDQFENIKFNELV